MNQIGKEFADIREGEALVYKTSASGPAVLIARVQASEWIALAGRHSVFERSGYRFA